MTNRNYIRGYETERKAFAELEAQGFYCIRSSGSHTIIDLIAIPTTKTSTKAEYQFHNKIRLIQLKRTKNKKLHPSDYKQDIQGLENFELYYPENMTKELWIWQDHRGWIKKVIE